MERPEDRIALIEFIGRDGTVQRTVDVWHWPVTLGRALSNTVVVEDPHVAAHHARLAPGEDGRVLLQTLPSRNGVLLNGQPLAGSAPLPASGARLQLGATALRLRLTGETLAHERALEGALRGLAPTSLRTPLLLGLALMALLAAGHWTGIDPGADYSAWLPLVVGLPGALAAWCGLWALGSKLFQHRFDFTGHLRIALPWLLALTALGMAWPQLTAALALPTLWMAGGMLQTALFALLVHAHLAHTLPQHRRAVTASVAAMFLAGGALSLALTWRASDRLVALPYMSTLPPPALRLGGTVPSATLVQDIAPLAARLARRVQQARTEDPEGDAEAESD